MSGAPTLTAFAATRDARALGAARRPSAREQRLEALLANAVERLEVGELAARALGLVAARAAAPRQDHLVLARVLERDELEHLRLVAAGLEQQRAHAVGHHLGFLAEVDAVPEQAREQARPRELRPELLVAARRADEDRGAGAQAEVDRVVGRGVAGVQGDHHVDRRRARTCAGRPRRSEGRRSRSARRRRCRRRPGRHAARRRSLRGATPKRRRRCSWTANVR